MERVTVAAPAVDLLQLPLLETISLLLTLSLSVFASPNFCSPV